MPIEGPPLRGPAAPLPLVVQAALERSPDAVALASEVRRITWRELDRLSSALAAGYGTLGLAPGDRVASLMPNRIDLVIHYIACARAGLVATPLNYRYTATEIDHALEVSGAAALLVHAERAADVAASRLAPDLPRGVISYQEQEPAISAHRFEALAAEEPRPADLPTVDLAAPAAIFFTSGSTGPAKGVTHTFETLAWMCAATADAFGLTPDDVFVPGSSMSHVGSFLWTFATLSAGARVAVVRDLDAHGVLTMLRAERPTVLAMLPAALTALLRDHDVTPEDFASLRICRAGSDKVSVELESEFAHLVGFPIVEGYGMTEVGMATLNPPSGLVKPGSIGRPVGGFAIALRDEAGGEVPTGTTGRVWIKSPTCTVGYWGDPAASAEILEDGWLDSGDLASADEDGYLWFFGRKKQIIVHDGSNISPFEVEGALTEHPAVALAGVVGIHDLVHGENVRAYVTVEAGERRPTANELIAFARARVGYKAPEEVVFLDEMPLNPTGKIDRVGLKRIAEEHLHPHGLP